MLYQVWNWLPAFRAIAETEHLPTASSQLHVSRSALSRSLSLLEAGLRRRFFRRDGRRLHLNAEGRALLEQVRAVEWLLVTAIQDIGAPPDERVVVRIATMGQLGRTHLLPALEALETSGWSTPVEVSSSNREPALAALVRGELDALLGYDCPPVPTLHTTPLPSPPIGLYVGTAHPSFGHASLERLLKHAFVAPPRRSPDAVWPSAVPRHIALTVDSADAALHHCLSGRYVMAMSVASAQEFVTQGRLRGAPAHFVPTPALCLVRSGRPASHRALEALTHALGDVALRCA